MFGIFTFKNDLIITKNILHEHNNVQHRLIEWEILSFLFIM